MLKVEGGGEVTGSFTSDKDGDKYEVKGKVGMQPNAVQFTINDVGGGIASASSHLAVEDATWLASSDLLFETKGQAFATAVAAFVYGNPGAPAGDFTATINWGDGTTSTGTIAANGYGGFNVVGKHAYAQAGTYTIHVGVKDIYGSSLAVDSTAYVSAVG